MAQHYTQNTISDRAFCNKCHTQTDHAVICGRLAHCIPCSERAEVIRKEKLHAMPAATQSLLFAQEVLPR